MKEGTYYFVYYTSVHGEDVLWGKTKDLIFADQMCREVSERRPDAKAIMLYKVRTKKLRHFGRIEDAHGG